MALVELDFETPRALTDFVNGDYAVGELQVVAQSQLVDGNYFILSDGTTVVTFYYDVSGEFEPEGGYDAENMRIDVSGVTDIDEVATATKDVINDSNLDITADSDSDGLVTLVDDDKISDGNVDIVLDETLDPEFTALGMTGGRTPIAQIDVVDIFPKDCRWYLFYEG